MNPEEAAAAAASTSTPTASAVSDNPPVPAQGQMNVQPPPENLDSSLSNMETVVGNMTNNFETYAQTVNVFSTNVSNIVKEILAILNNKEFSARLNQFHDNILKIQTLTNEKDVLSQQYAELTANVEQLRAQLLTENETNIDLNDKLKAANNKVKDISAKIQTVDNKMNPLIESLKSSDVSLELNAAKTRLQELFDDFNSSSDVFRDRQQPKKRKMDDESTNGTITNYQRLLDESELAPPTVLGQGPIVPGGPGQSGGTRRRRKRRNSRAGARTITRAKTRTRTRKYRRGRSRTTKRRVRHRYHRGGYRYTSSRRLNKKSKLISPSIASAVSSIYTNSYGR